MNVFGLLKQNHKKLLAKKTKFSPYNINKADFISLIQKAKRQGISSRNIESALRATGLILFNSSVIFWRLKINKKLLSASFIMTTSFLNNSLITSSVTLV